MDELYIWEILQGKPEIKFKGIYPLIEEFMHDRKYPQDQVEQVRFYTTFLLARAKGEVKTGALMIREFVMAHPDYKHDSLITNKIAYDLLKSIDHFQEVQEQVVMESMQNVAVSGHNYGPKDLSLLSPKKKENGFV